MANPQLEHGHIRIANEIIDEVLRRDFSKRQQSILHFIWRLSYGCNKKTATIPRLKDFELCGVSPQNIKAELEHLEVCKVIFWDQKSNKFEFNKNHKEWIVTPKKGWNRSDFDKLLHLNIQENFSKQEVKTSQNKKFNKGNGKEPTSQNKKKKRKKVLKLRSYDFLKQEVQNGINLYRTRLGWAPKDSIKDIFKDIKEEDEEGSAPVDPVIDLLVKNKIVHPGGITPTLADDLNDIENHFGFDDPTEMIIEAIKDAVRGNGRTWKFIYNKLNLWRKQGIKNKSDLKFHVSKTIPFRPRRKKQINWEEFDVSD